MSNLTGSRNPVPFGDMEQKKDVIQTVTWLREVSNILLQKKSTLRNAEIIQLMKPITSSIHSLLAFERMSPVMCCPDTYIFNIFNIVVIQNTSGKLHVLRVELNVRLSPILLSKIPGDISHLKGCQIFFHRRIKDRIFNSFKYLPLLLNTNTCF